ncbi:MAG TPA: DNA repair protein RadA [Steroidobacteraceae bacterium]|nr:DNA repair protein RadA [Steroidobacteraceae bacterium]
MAKPSTVFVCAECAAETLKWQGQCPQCSRWNTLEQRTVARRPSGAAALASVAAAQVSPLSTEELPRLGSGMGELDRVLGGGLIPGSVTLLGGEPGIGKSTLLLQLANHAARATPTLYLSAEESAAQIGVRARRLGMTGEGLRVVADTDLEAAMVRAREESVKLMIVDSIQTVQLQAVGTPAGAVTQLKECTAQLVRFAKSNQVSVLIVGHVTKDGAIAGPRVLEHLVDTVLYFESDASSRFRNVRATKNRFGSVGELAFFHMDEQGLREVRNPSAIFLARAGSPAPGSIVAVTRDGRRPLLVELQGLVDRMRFGSPRRVAQGLDAQRVAMLLAVLNRHGGVSLQEHDVFVNVVGGLEISETACDLPVALALASSLVDKPIAQSLVAFGEIGLTGELRPVAYGEERLREAAKQGFTTALVAKDNAPRAPIEGVRVHALSRIDEALRIAIPGS